MFIRTFVYPDDFESVVHLWQRSTPAIHLGFSDTEAEIIRKLTYHPELFLVAEAEGRIIGSVLGGYDGRRGIIYHLAVEESHRNRGAGTALMDEIEDRLQELGCYKAYLLIMRDNQEVAAFYQQLGWQLMPVVTMGKELR
jgi:ribosomal protein S18 acetylase RimI-like enzyme